MKVIYLQPHSPWRSAFRSDTLWGLLCWGVRYVWGESRLIEMLERFNSGSPPFLVSSVFPYRMHNSRRELLMPRPIFHPFRLSPEELTPETMRLYKKYKKVTFIPQLTFQKLIKGDLKEKEYFLNYQNEWQELTGAPARKEVSVHNTIDRLHGGSLQEGGLYNLEEFSARQAGGRYFLLKIYDQAYQNILTALWPFFEHMGMGGDSSVGKGWYKITEDEFADFNVPGAENFVTLSLYSPGENEAAAFSKQPNRVWYKLDVRKGRVGGKLFVTGKILKQPLVMFAEGSSFPQLSDQNNYGTMRLVKTEPHHVYQNGYAFAIPCV